jgi:8-oxo-dGTP diphosphatase
MARNPGKRDAAADDEARFLAGYDPNAFQRPSVAVDVVLLSAFEGDLYTLLVRRHEHPHKDRWALPGGFVRLPESLDDAAARTLRDKAGLASVFLEQLFTFGAPRRDPRMRVISVAYYALVERARFLAASERNAGVASCRLQVPWPGETGGPVGARDAAGEQLPLAFDHADILGLAVKRLRGKLDYAPIGFQLLVDTFTLLDLQRVHETILHRALNKDSFRRRMLASGLVKATGRSQTGVEHRPAELYRFVTKT